MPRKKKRNISEEQKEVLRARMAMARATKAAKQKAEAEAAASETEPVQTDLVEAVEASEQEQLKREETLRMQATADAVAVETVKNGGEDTAELLRQAVEAIATLAKLQAAGINTQNPSGPQLQNGKVVGVIEKYSLDPDNYPSPVERLKAEAKLAPYAFPLNYDLEYTVTTTSYESKEGLNYIEPKFTLELHRLVRDPMTNEDTGRRYIICRLIMHEDPQTAIKVARDNDIAIDNENELAFLNEMRYIQMRDWVFEAFFTPMSTNRKERGEMVVDGKLVEFFEINDENSPGKLPFDSVKKFNF